MNIKELNYPMFELTVDEAWLLIQARKHLKEACSYRLCNSLWYVYKKYRAEESRIDKLKLKIQKSLGCHITLESYFNSYHLFRSEKIKLRKEWIRKLLKHNQYLL